MVKLLGGEIEKADLLRKIGRIEQVAGARPVKLASGKAEGIKAWEIYNGSGLEFCVMESKCLDLLYAKYRGVNLSFLAKPGAVGIWSLLSWWNAVYVWPWQYWTKLCG